MASSTFKAVVSEENGEISCSVDETNRIRRLLGLKPLNVTTQTAEFQAVENFRAKKEMEASILETESIRLRIEKARDKRILKENIPGASLGKFTTSGGDDDSALGSAAEWVRRSRIKSSETKMEIIDKVHNVSNYDSNDLSGLKVMHDAKNFEVGEEIILTLCDSNILDTDDNGKITGIKDMDDVLENVNIAEEEKHLEIQNRKKRSRLPAYIAFDDDEFAEGFIPGSKKGILQQYDKESNKGPRLELGIRGGVELENFGGISRSAGTIAATSLSGMGNSGDSSTNHGLGLRQPSSDFYTHSEYSTAFKTKKREKKRRDVRKATDEEGDEIAGSRDSVKLDEILGVEEEAETTGSKARSGDHGSRSQKKLIKEVVESRADEAKRRAAYETAIKLANEKTKNAFTNSATSAYAEDFDQHLGQSLAQARQNSIIQQSALRAKERESGGFNDDGGALFAFKMMGTSGAGDSMDVAESKGSNGNGVNGVMDEDSLDSEGRRMDGRLVFTSTTEFTSRMQALLNEKARAHAEKAFQDQERDVESRNNAKKASAAAHALAGAGGGEGDEGLVRSMDIEAEDVDKEEEDEEEEEGVDRMNAEVEEEKDVVDQQMGFIHRQPLASASTSAALALLKSSGELKSKDHLAGRSKDERDRGTAGGADAEDGGGVDAADRIQLDYRDSFGRKLTKKEAYRQLCYKFHGYGPGKKKLDKRIQAMENQVKSGTSFSALDSVTMKSLTKAQEATGKAHITIQGGSSTGPNSNLAALLLSKSKKKKEIVAKKQTKK